MKKKKKKKSPATMAAFVARRFTTKLIRPSHSSYISVLPAHSISSSPKPFTFASSSPSLKPLKKPMNHYISFFRFYSSYATKFNSLSHSSEIRRDPINKLKFFSTSDDDTKSEKIKHQDIEGSTVERDLSALANDTRQVLDGMTRTIFDLSTAVALLGLAQLSCGAWIYYITRSSPISEVSIQSLVAVAFPFSFAFLLRRSLKPICFFRKMEEQGRLQILDSTLQIAKNVDLFFVRAHRVSLICSVGMSVGLLFTALSR